MAKIQNFLTLGTRDAEQRRIKLTEIYCIFLMFSQLAYAVFYLAIDLVLVNQVIVQVVFSIPPVISLILINKRKYNAAKICLTYFAPWPVIIGSVFFLGKDAGTHFYLLFYAVLPVTIWTYKNIKHSLFLFCFNLFWFLLIEISDLESLAVTKLPAEYVLFHSVECYVICFIAIGINMLMYQAATDRYENLLHMQSDRLKETNIRLTEQKEVVSEINKLLKERQQHINQQSEELKMINKELKEAVATKDKFFSIVAHDLKNPLGTLTGFSEILRNEKDRFDDNKKERIFKAIYDSAKSAFNLLDNLLIWSRTQTDGIISKPVVMNFYDLVHEISLLLKNMRMNKNIGLEIDVDKNQEVFADRFMLSSVINNLMSNAVKFTPAGGHIRISAAPGNDGFVEVCVSDTGVGISGADIKRLFRIDQSHSTHGTNDEKGTGLGLLLCKEFVEKNGGDIWVESEPGTGSRFFFTVMTKNT